MLYMEDTCDEEEVLMIFACDKISLFDQRPTTGFTLALRCHARTATHAHYEQARKLGLAFVLVHVS